MEKSDTPSIGPKDVPVPKRTDAPLDAGQLWPEKRKTVSSARAEQCEAFKKTLEESLAKWTDVQTPAEYDRLRSLLEKYAVVPNLGDTQFQSMNGGVGITVKNVGGLLKIYNNPDSAQPHSKWPSIREIGTIKDGKFEETGTWNSYLFQKMDDRADNSPVPQDIPECTPDERKTAEPAVTPPGATKPSPIPPPPKAEPVPKAPDVAATAPVQPEKSPDAHVKYEIKEWDSLWMIIKKQYGLSDKYEDARLVGNILNLILKDPRNAKSIRGAEYTIFPRDTLFLPKEGSFSYGWRKPETFRLIGKIDKTA